MMVCVLHYVGSLQIGGIQSMVENMYAKIDRTKIRLDLVSFPNERGRLYDELAESGANIYPCPKYNGLNHFEFVKWWESFFCVHRQYSILHVHVTSIAPLVCNIAKKYGIFVVVHGHNQTWGKGLKGVVKWIFGKFTLDADYLFACSDIAGQFLLGKDIKNNRNYKMIPNGIDCRRFGFQPLVRGKARSGMGCHDAFVVGHVGRLTAIKNQTFLLEAFFYVRKEHFLSKLLVVGEGELRLALEAKAEQLGIADAVIWAGSRPNVEDYYQAMDVFVLPSFSEGLSLAAIEAQCSGLPCVLSAGVPKEADMGSGLFVRKSLSEGAKSWADAILSRMGWIRRDGREAVRRAGFDASETAAWLEDFYLRIASGEKVSFR